LVSGRDGGKRRNSSPLTVITGQNGSDAIFQGAADFDLELLESRTLDGK
jgi:hypothetical protein